MDSHAFDIARAYDEVPYTSRPFAQTQPQRLAGTARLFGLTPPDVATARVLELGSAAGGNIIPLALQFPGAEFTGVDLSSQQIAQGNARIAHLGLKNIRLATHSIADITRGFGTFDYIICHGVYSWVPAHVRDAILRVSSENLSENGVAYVSYNVYPGWRLRTVLRDAMLFHATFGATPGERVKRSREFLNLLSSTTNAGTAYGQMLRHEAQNMANFEDSYITHEYLEMYNEPCHVSEFLKRLDVFNLAFLTEADLHLTIAENFGAETGALLRTLSENRLDRMEQYIDFLTGRTFRQSLMVRKDKAAQIKRTLAPENLQGLHLSTRVSADFETLENGSFQFKDPAGRTVTTSSTTVRDRIAELARCAPASATPEDLIANLSSDGDGDPQDTADVMRALFNMVLAGIADVSTVPVAARPEVSAQPKATAIARSDAETGMTWTTNARHETVALDAVQRALLPHLDGTHDREALTGKLRELVASGGITFNRGGTTLTDASEISNAIDEHVSRALDSFQRALLLAA